MTVVLRAPAHDEGHGNAMPVRTRRLLIGVFLFAGVGVAVAAVLAMFLVFGAHHGVARVIARVVPVPAAVVDGRVVWYREVSERANALEALEELTPDAAMDRALMLAEHAAMVANLAEELHVGAPTPTGAIMDAVARDAAVEEAAFDNAALQATARARMESVQLKLRQGIAFADLAAQYGEGDAVLTDGDIGYVHPDDLPEELRTVARTIAAGATSDIVQTHRAFWLVKAEDVLESDDGARSVRLRVIEVKKDVLGDVVDERLKTARVREFIW